MKLSLTAMKVAIHPMLVDVFAAYSNNNARTIIGAQTIGALTDNSTGTSAANIAAVPVAVAVTPSGSNLAPRALFNTAIGKADNAITVLATYLNTWGLTPMGVDTITLAGGTVATPGTIPAMDLALVGTDGSASAAMLLTEANAALVVQRNNLAVVIRAYNIMATALGAATLADVSGGTVGTAANARLTMTAKATAASVVADPTVVKVASDASVDAALLSLAAQVATLKVKIATILFASGTLTARVPVALVP